MTPHWELRAQIAGLVAESRRTRTMERRAYSATELLRIRSRLSAGELKPTQVERIMGRARSGYVVGKKLPPDRQDIIAGVRSLRRGQNEEITAAKIDPDWLTSNEESADDLHYFRTVSLRRELRILNLAYGFLNGLALHDMEKKGYRPIPLKSVATQAALYSPEGFSMETFESWVSEIDGTKHPAPANIEKKVENLKARLAAATNEDYREKLLDEIEELQGAQEQHHAEE